MTIAELGSLGEFVSSIAVVITLVYLVIQVRQNTISTRSQSRYHILEALNADMKLNMDPTFRHVFFSGSDSAEDKLMGHWYWQSMLSHQEMLFFEIEDGAVPATFRATLRYRVATMFTFAESQLYWAANRNLFTPVFQKYIDDLLPQVDEILTTESMNPENPYDFVARYLQNKRGSVD